MTATIPNVPGTNTGHGRVWPRPDGRTYRCGGLRMCPACRDDQAVIDAGQLGHAYLVIHSSGGIGLADLDPDRAHEYARNTGSVVISAPIVADYRTQPEE